MAGKIFLNYRRDDSEAWADRLFDRLTAHFPRENVFLDIDGDIPIGTPWAVWLDQEVAKCDLMLTLIGRSWVSEFEARRDPESRDFVRVEIERALARGIPVAPVLLGDVEMPPRSVLPESVRQLCDLQMARLNRFRFDDDVERLIINIERSINYVKLQSGLPAVDTEQNSESDDSTANARRMLRQAFWTECLEAMNASEVGIYQNVSPSKNHWLNGGSGISGCSYTMIFSKYEARVQFDLMRSKIKDNKNLFDLLEVDRIQIEKDFGAPLIWKRLNEKKMSYILYSKPFDGYNREAWPEIISWHIEHIKRLERAISPHIGRLRSMLKSDSSS